MSREVLQMALEVLKGCLEHPDAQDSIIAIEHELAQPKQEPIEWYDKIMGVEVSMDVSTGEDDISHRVFGRVYEVMLEAGGAQNDIILAIEDSRNFTSPPQRQPLRGEQIYELFVKTLPKITLGMTYVPEWAIPIARAIEAKHGIGDKT